MLDFRKRRNAAQSVFVQMSLLSSNRLIPGDLYRRPTLKVRFSIGRHTPVTGMEKLARPRLLQPGEEGRKSLASARR